MIGNIITKFKNSKSEKKVIISNFFSLATLEVINYIIPLITIPYLVRVLQPAKYGLVAFAQVFASYFVIAVDYGFYLSAPREIAINRDDLEKISKIFSNIMATKFCLMLIATIFFLTLIFCIKRFAEDKILFLFSFGNVLGDYLFPVWFFQGMQRMKLITFFYSIAKIFFLIMIFLFIKSPADYFYVPLFNNLGLIIAGFLSLYIIIKNFKIRIYLPALGEILKEIKNKFSYFISTISINAYTNSGAFILGLFAGNLYVGYYSAAERLIRAIQRILWAGSQSVYPYINRLVSKSETLGLRFIKKFMIIFNGGFFVISMLIFIFAKRIVFTVLGQDYLESVNVLYILSFLPFIISLSNILGIQTMLSWGLIKDYSKIVFSAMLINISLSIIMANIYKHIGIAFAVVLTELYIAIVAFILLKIKKINLFLKNS
ncbi:MAG: flippase [bacterium]